MKHRKRLPLLIALLLPTFLVSAVHGFASLPPQYSNLNWDEGFGLPGTNNEIFAVVWANGDVYAGGDFTAVAGSYVNRIARWDGASWLPLGTEFINGVDGIVRAIAVDGDNVYVGGDFKAAAGQTARNIAVWNKQTNAWSTLGGGIGGLVGSTVTSIVKHNGDIYVAGRFLAAGNTVAVNIARWDGSRWHRVGSGVNNDVHALHVDGNYLYAAGTFTIAGAVRTRSLARYNLTTGVWEDVGATIAGTVSAIASDNQYIYIGGAFVTLNGENANNIARMDKSTGAWTHLDRGLSGEVKTITIRGSQVVVGGRIYGIVGRNFPNGYEVRRTALWDGTEWSTFARRSAASGRLHAASGVIKVTRFEGGDGSWGRSDGSAVVNAIAVDNTGALYFGGLFDIAGPAYVVQPLVPDAFVVRPDPETAAANNFCKLSGNDTVWRPLGGGLDDDVYAFADDGTYLYVGGAFRNVSEYRVNHIARIHKETRAWEPLGGGVNGNVNALVVDGNNIYVGGSFSAASGVAANGVARWNSATQTWSAVGNANFSSIATLALVDGNLYAGGAGISYWNGSAWNSVPNAPDRGIRSIVRNGNSLYVGGQFTTAGSVAAKNVAKMDITTGQWSTVGSGLDSAVRALLIWNGDLYAGGLFPGHISTWNTSTQAWETVGVGVKGDVYALAVGRFGLYAAGNFLFAQGGVSANSVALWNNELWQTLGSGVQGITAQGIVHAILSDDESLYVGGDFLISGGKTAYYLGRWFFPPPNQILSADLPIPGYPAHGVSSMSAEIFPNPVQGTASLQLNVSSASQVSAEVYNTLGEKVLTITDGGLEKGQYRFPIRADMLSSGAWLLRIQTEHGTVTRTFVVE